jgi:hypothetical protein
LDDVISGSNELKLFLKKVAVNVGIDTTQGYDSLFDIIEGDIYPFI